MQHHTRDSIENLPICPLDFSKFVVFHTCDYNFLSHSLGLTYFSWNMSHAETHLCYK
jgi:hypothetical protein